MLNVLRMYQIFLPGILIVVLLVVVDLVLVLVVAVMSWAVSEVGQLDTLRVTYCELCKRDSSVLIAIIERDNPRDST